MHYGEGMAFTNTFMDPPIKALVKAFIKPTRLRPLSPIKAFTPSIKAFVAAVKAFAGS